MDKKNHHYVPQFLLRNFSENKKSIGMFINDNSTFIGQASIRKQALKAYLYGKNNDIENMFMDIEAKASGIIRKIIDAKTLPEYDSEEYHILMLFILISEARVQKQAESNENLITELAKVTSKMYQEHGRLDVPDEVINNLKVTYDVPNLISIQAAIELYPIILDLKAVILTINNDRSFITSDIPIVRYNYMYVKRNYQIRGYGLGTMGIQIFFPISPKHCIYIYDDVMYQSKIVEKSKIILSKATQVDELNKLFYLNSYKYLFFSENIKESYIKRFVENLKHVSSLDKEIGHFGNNSNKLIWCQHKFVKNHISMPFLSINPKLINMPLPPHMAGPIRPYARKFN
jgi:hypothetical protein